MKKLLIWSVVVAQLVERVGKTKIKKKEAGNGSFFKKKPTYLDNQVDFGYTDLNEVFVCERSNRLGNAFSKSIIFPNLNQPVA